MSRNTEDLQRQIAELQADRAKHDRLRRAAIFRLDLDAARSEQSAVDSLNGKIKRRMAWLEELTQ